MSTNLSNINSVGDLMSRVGANDVLMLLRRLGFWAADPDDKFEPKAFNKNPSRLTSDQLGDEYAYWQSELSRATEIVGALRGRRHEVALQFKRAKERGLKAHLESLPEGAKTPTKDVLAAHVSALPDVIEAEDAITTLDAAITTLEGVVNAYDGYIRMLSREISRRGDQMRARMQ